MRAKIRSQVGLTFEELNRLQVDGIDLRPPPDSCNAIHNQLAVTKSTSPFRLSAITRLRLVYRTPDWEDLVYLAFVEIRQFGGTSI
jgi:hypothetical protein